MIMRAIVVWLVILFASPTMAMDLDPWNQIQRLCYKCSFLSLGSVASLQLIIVPSVAPQTHRVVLQGKGSGIIGWLSGNRHQYYESLVRLDTDNIVTTLSHFHQTDINHNSQRIQYGWKFTFSELSHAVKGERFWGGNVVETALYSPDHDAKSSRRVVGDFLSALFSFMKDSAQPLEVGLHYQFLVFNRDDYVDLDIDVIDYHEQSLWQCRVRSDSSCLPGGGNEMIFYCNDNRIPLAAATPEILGGVRVTGTRCVEE